LRNSNTFISYTGQKWLILALAGVLLAGSVSGCGSLGAGNPRQEMQQETQESLSGTQENSAGHTAGRTDGGETGKEEEREKETKEKDTQEKETKDEYKPYIWNRGYGPQVKLPAAYDYRTEGRAPQIGNQGSLGTCWAFASLTALESSLLPGQRMTFAVDHMSMHNNFLLSQDEGGEYTMSMAYLLAWQGPVLESEDPYGDGYSPDGLMPRKHVQEIQVLKAKDYDAVKRAVYLEGGVQSSLYTSMRDYQSESVYYNRETNSYCYMGSEKPNHDSVIVGWDDNYSRENFNMDLEGDGAFICTNSWGEDFGDQGYFYVSYYDTNIGVHNIVYTGVEQVNNYDRIHQSDLCGWVGQIGYGQDEAWFSNAYRAGSEEMLAAAGFYATDSDTQYELYVARHLPEAGDPELEKALNSRTLLARGKLANAGFYTIPLEEKILLDDDEKFAIIVKIITPGTVHPVAIEYDAGDGIALVDLKDGEGYLSHDGNVWEHVEETQGCNICLKVYTKYK
jgi:C1A family cysteine protease